MSRILFMCRFGGAGFGYAGMPDGYSVTVYDNGDMYRRGFVLGNDRPVREKKLASVPELAEKIGAIIAKHHDELEKIPEELDNGTLDGPMDRFQFGDKKIQAWCIQRIDLSECSPEYAEEYRENIMYENTVLDIYDEIAREN